MGVGKLLTGALSSLKGMLGGVIDEIRIDEAKSDTWRVWVVIEDKLIAGGTEFLNWLQEGRVFD